MAAPAVVIRLELEAAPRVLVEATNQAEFDRLVESVFADDDVFALVARVARLIVERRAA